MNTELIPPIDYIPPEHQLRRMTNAQLDRILVRLFSTYIRLRDSDAYGIAKCFTCQRTDHWTNMHCGHFMRRANMCTRFMEINNHVQCPTCNISYDGNRTSYTKELDKKYGKGTAEYIEELSRKTCKWMRSDYIDAIRTTEKALWGEN